MPSPNTAGQASVEYLGAIALVAAVLTFAAPAVGAPDIPRAVVHGIRLGICFVAGDYCDSEDARADGLAPCMLSRETRGEESQVSVAFFKFGGQLEWTLALGSDGQVLVTYTSGGSAGLVAGVGATAQALRLDLDLGAEASVGLRVQGTTAWRFSSWDVAKRFLRELPGSSVRRWQYPAEWHSADGGPEAAAQVKAALHGADGASLGTSARAAAGVRFGPGRTVTLYNLVSLTGPEAQAAFGGPSIGRGTSKVMVEYTLAGTEPAEIAFRQVVPSEHGKRLTETVKRLDLRNPVNRAWAQPLLRLQAPWPPAVAAEVRHLLGYIDEAGTSERATYRLDDNSSNSGFGAKMGQELGISHTSTRVEQWLEEADGRAFGSDWRERFDCVGQMP